MEQSHRFKRLQISFRRNASWLDSDVPEGLQEETKSSGRSPLAEKPLVKSDASRSVVESFSLPISPQLISPLTLRRFPLPLKTTDSPFYIDDDRSRHVESSFDGPKTCSPLFQRPSTNSEFRCTIQHHDADKLPQDCLVNVDALLKRFLAAGHLLFPGPISKRSPEGNGMNSCESGVTEDNKSGSAKQHQLLRWLGLTSEMYKSDLTDRGEFLKLR